MPRLSPTQTDALDAAKTAGALKRFPGGFWSWEDCPTRRSGNGELVPEAYWGWGTVQALITAGHLEISGRDQRLDPNLVTVTALGASTEIA